VATKDASVDSKLASKISEALAINEQIVFATRRDPICILPEVVKTFMLTVIFLMFAYSLKDVGFGFERWFPSTGILSRFSLVAIGILWAKFFLGTWMNWSYEILAITRDPKSGPRVWYRHGYWLRKIASVKVSSLVSTPIDQSKHYYSTLLGVGSLRLDVYGSDDADLRFSDCPKVFDVVQLCSRLLAEKNNI
jgi:hypothetical protein